MPGEILDFGPLWALQLLEESQELDARGLRADADTQFQRALAAIDTSSRRDPGSEQVEARLYAARAEQLARRGEYAAALRFADTADRIRLRTGEAVAGTETGRLRARLLWAMGDVDAALERARLNLSSAAADAESQAGLRLDLAEYLRAAELPDEALGVLSEGDREAVRASGQFADWAWLEGMCARDVGRFERAERCLRLAFHEWLEQSRWTPAVRAASFIAQLAVEQGRPSELLALAATLEAALDPLDPKAQQIGASFRQAIERPDALERLRELDRSLTED